ncbi:hypothetical protein PFISCL1PPCAC_23603, partial [Pristionchus fissidentatus]
FIRCCRDLFEGGFVICTDYDTIRRETHEYDRAMLPLVNQPVCDRDSLQSILTVESALMEYGSCEWTEWMGRRLIYHNYDDEVIRFYHRTIAERECNAQDERLILRLREALTRDGLKEVKFNEERMKVDAFVNSTVETVNRGDRLVNIEPPFRSVAAAEKLAAFIRSRRIPP